MADRGAAAELVEVWRGPFLESTHRGHAVICDASGEILTAWGDPDAVILPRSACKIIQALPLLESGAAEAAGLAPEQLALACASHRGAAIHTERVARWLADLGLGDDDLRCGPQMPADRDAAHAMIRADRAPCQIHNNCSGKHAGFLTLGRHLRAGPEYIDPGHPVQRAVKTAFEEVTGAASPGHAIDGCSAPNFATTVRGLARGMARFATAGGGGDARARAMRRLVEAMAAHPALISGEGGTCTDLIRALRGRAVVKTGAEAVYTGIVPDRGLGQGLGVAVKILDGGTRAAETVIAALMIRLGVLEASHPVARRLVDGPILNRRGIAAATIRPAAALR